MISNRSNLNDLLKDLSSFVSNQETIKLIKSMIEENLNNT